MREPEGPLSAIAAPIADEFARWQATPEYKRNLIRASYGAFMLANAATWAPTTLFRVPRGPDTSGDWVVIGLGAGWIGLGLLWLVVGIRGARGPRDVMSAFWWAIGTLACVGALWWEAYPADWGPYAASLLKDIYIGALALCAMRVWLATRGMGRGSKAPRPHPSPQGRAGDASPAEAYHAMRGGGGDRLSLDDKEF